MTQISKCKDCGIVTCPTYPVYEGGQVCQPCADIRIAKIRAATSQRLDELNQSFLLDIFGEPTRPGNYVIGVDPAHGQDTTIITYEGMKRTMESLTVEPKPSKAHCHDCSNAHSKCHCPCHS